MSTTILTYLKGMNKLLTIPKFWGPLLTIGFTIVYHLIAARQGFSITVGWLFLFVIAGAFIGGWQAGLIAAAWASLYSFYIMPGSDWILTAQRIAVLFLGAGLVGWQTHHLREYYKAADELLNGNTLRLNEALADLRRAKDELRAARKSIEKSEDKFGNVLAKVVGYSALRRRMDEVQAGYSETIGDDDK